MISLLMLMMLMCCCVGIVVSSEQWAATAEAEAELSARVGWFRARRTGMNFRNVRRHAAALIDSGEITPDMTHEQMATVLLDDIRSENPRAFNDVSERNWQAFFDFILKILPIILAIFGL